MSLEAAVPIGSLHRRLLPFCAQNGQDARWIWLMTKSLVKATGLLFDRFFLTVSYLLTIRWYLVDLVVCFAVESPARQKVTSSSSISLDFFSDLYDS